MKPKCLIFIAPMLFACAARSSIPNGDGATTCTPPPTPALSTPPNPPDAVGCYVDQNNAWVKVPCNCEVPMNNSSSEPASVRFTLSANVAPSLHSDPDVEITFPDADGTLFEAWSAQTGSGQNFVVTSAKGTTTVRLGADNVTLDEVSLTPCLFASAQASVSGSSEGKLDVHVDSTNGDDSIDATCVDIPHP